jgi:hypothetical protein
MNELRMYHSLLEVLERRKEKRGSIFKTLLAFLKLKVLQ